MNATGLPIQLPSAPQGGAELAPAPAATSGSQAPTDFVLALAQMLGTSVPATNAEGQITALPNARKQETDIDASDALALLSLPMAPASAQLAAQQTHDLDPLEMLGLTRGDNTARDAAILQALTERLAAVEESPDDAQLPSGAVQATGDAAQLRAVQNAAAGRALHSPVGTQAWADELGSRLTMMTNKGEHTASLRLSPENLGPLEIRIAMREDQASVWFGAAHADTRAAIEQALPRLRELFAAQGMSLADAGVSREPPKQQPTEWRHGLDNNDSAAGAEPVSAAVSVQVGLLDAYA